MYNHTHFISSFQCNNNNNFYRSKCIVIVKSQQKNTIYYIEIEFTCIERHRIRRLTILKKNEHILFAHIFLSSIVEIMIYTIVNGIDR